jgi:hypothetical protein
MELAERRFGLFVCKRADDLKLVQADVDRLNRDSLLRRNADCTLGVIRDRQMPAVVSIRMLCECRAGRRQEEVKMEVRRLPEGQTRQLTNQSDYCISLAISLREHSELRSCMPVKNNELMPLEVPHHRMSTNSEFRLETRPQREGPRKKIHCANVQFANLDGRWTSSHFSHLTLWFIDCVQVFDFLRAR